MLQLYPENNAQRELILSSAMRAGFSGGVVVDYPHRYAKYLFGQSYNVPNQIVFFAYSSLG